MSAHQPAVRETFVAAYPEYVATILGERRVDIDGTIADGIVIGTGVLDGLLASLEAKPTGLAMHSPLELFREALRPVDNALAVAGIEPPEIDNSQKRLLPWDRYDLSPGSAQQLGPAAYEAHLQWGIEKVRAHVGKPTAGLRCRDEDAPRLLEQLDNLGYRVIRLPASEPVSIAVMDIESRETDAILSELSTAGTPAIVFGHDPDDLEQLRFKALGATEVLPKRMVLDDLAEHIPIIV